jgi:FKBP-type peptidyl-prolyl cis-trans isomerase
LIRGRLDELGIRPWFSPLELGQDDQIYELAVSIKEVFTESELRQVRAEERLAEDNELEALHCMARAKDSLAFSDDDWHDGIYFRTIRKGSGARPQSGNLARVHYKTYLCDGRMVDDTYRAEVFEYPIGKPDQVLPGFAVAIARMRVGEHAIFLIPSDLAFGAKGSSSGLVPPHTALIYEATLLELR